MKLIVITFALFVTGCDYSTPPKPHHFKCSESQLKELKSSFEICSSSNAYSNDYCYRMAKSLYCEDIRK